MEGGGQGWEDETDGGGSAFNSANLLYLSPALPCHLAILALSNRQPSHV